MDATQELLECAVSNWHDRFSDVTFKTILVPLPREFVDWIVSDGVILPEGSNAFPTRAPQEEFPTEDDYQDWSSEDNDETNNPDTDTTPPGPSAADFPDIINTVTTAIAELEGAVAPKFTWSCPKDAVWMTGNTLRCTNADEVVLLLKSSDRVAHDICHAVQDTTITTTSSADAAPSGNITTNKTESNGDNSSNDISDGSVQHVLALRKWYGLLPGREFRCFVKNGHLVGISQRDLTQRFDFLPTESLDIQKRISNFHQHHIAHRFPLPHYVFDCYVPSGRTAPVKLLDFNPVGGTTASLLFEWEELFPLLSTAQTTTALDNDSTTATTAGAGACSDDNTTHKDGDTTNNTTTSNNGTSTESIEFRILTEDVPLRPATAVYGLPYDFVDTSEGSALSKLLEQAQDAGDLWNTLGNNANNNH